VATATATAVDKIEALMTTTRRHFLDTAAGDSGVTLSKVPRQLEPGMAAEEKFLPLKATATTSSITATSSPR